jgi:heterodisulfide reductase subunit C
MESAAKNERIILSEFNHQYFNNYNLSQHKCITCGICSSACPLAGIDGFDPRKLIRIASLGQNNEAVETKWSWICTMCGKCEELCPMEIPITKIVRTIRGMRDRDKVPGILHQGLSAALKTGNNLRLPKEDFEFIIQDVGEELAEEDGFADFKAPLDKKGANLMMTVHNKLVNTHTEDLKHLWKIFYAAKEDWTIPADNWEGTNWGLFTGDDDAMKKMTAKIAENIKRLEIKNFLWPE